MATANIIKGDRVKLEGQFHLELHHTPAEPQKNQKTPAVPAQARIVENQPEFAVIELTCSCGKKTFLRCDYIVEQPPPAENETEHTE